jgi:hypothetical protein
LSGCEINISFNEEKADQVKSTPEQEQETKPETVPVEEVTETMKVEESQQKVVTIKKSKGNYMTVSNGQVTFNGGTFVAYFPEEYTAHPSYSYNNNESFRMLTVNPGEENIHFLVYSGPQNETPDDFQVNESFETVQDEKQDGNVNWYTIEADDGSYIKTFKRTVYNDGGQLIVGLIFDTWDTYNQYKAQYLAFKSSVKKN